ncbi:MAG: hypothetical protein QM667_06960 [Asticcacaulis sp.]
MRLGLRTTVLTGLITGLCGCQTVGAYTPVPATVDMRAPQTVERVKTALAKAVGRAQIELGAYEYPTPSVLSVLPPPPGPQETHSMAMPTVFDIAIRNGKCSAIRRDDGVAFGLDGVTCHRITP